MKAQVSLEYLMMFGFVLLLILPSIYVTYQYMNTVSVETVSSRVETIGGRVIQNVETIYTYGKDSRTTVDFDLPPYVTEFDVTEWDGGDTGRELVVRVDIQSVAHEMVFFTDIPIFIGNCTHGPQPLVPSFASNPGRKELVIQSCGQNVSIFTP